MVINGISKGVIRGTIMLAAFTGVPVSWPALAGPNRAQAAPAAPSPARLQTGKGSFLFTDSVVNPGKPMTVWYCLPSGTSEKDAPILFVMHGTLRNGSEYRDQWADLAQKYRVLLIVPEFSSQDYPSSRYNRANVMDADDKVAHPRDQWTFQVIEHLFDEVKRKTGNIHPTYDIYGHSAGGQFVHRFVLFMPDARIRRAVAANSGYYTLPLTGYSDPYPFSVKGTAETGADVSAAFGHELVVLLGEDDTDPNDPDLYHSPEADKQGMYRLARGKFFYEQARIEAAKRGISFRWRLQTVAGAGHSNTKMAVAAAEALYGEPARP